MSSKRQCQSTITNPRAHNFGEPCRQWAVAGSDLCVVHGGAPLSGGLGKPSDFDNRCTAKSVRSGEQCKNPAIRGGNVCRIHGGSAAQVIKKARERFNSLIDPMITIAEKQVQAAMKGQMSHSDELALMRFIADRTGYTPGQSLAVEVEVKPWERTMQRIIREAPPELEAMPADPGLDDIEEAELVEDELSNPFPPENVLTFQPRVRGSSEPPERYR